MSPEVLVAGFVVVMIATAVQGSVGFGANLLAMPIMAQIDPDLVPGPTLMATALVSVLVLWNERDHLQIRPVSEALGGRIVGTGIAVITLGFLSERDIGFVIAFMVLGAVALTAFGVHAERSRRNMIAAGAVSGFSATTSGIGGPPVAILFTDASGPQIRSSLALYFFVGMLMTLGGLALAGRFEPHQAQASLFLIPAAAIGFLISRPLSRVVDKGYARPAILVLSSLAAISLLIKLLR